MIAALNRFKQYGALSGGSVVAVATNVGVL